jgi:hypothetical protein
MPGKAPPEIGRQPIGRITIANADSGATRNPTSRSIGHFRAVAELVDRNVNSTGESRLRGIWSAYVT